MAERIVRCRMTNATGDRCTGEALDPAGEVLICQRHAALVLELVSVHAGLREARENLREAREEAREARGEAREARAEAREVRSIVRDARATLRTAASDE